jgi:hypothetical protein
MRGNQRKAHGPMIALHVGSGGEKWSWGIGVTVARLASSWRLSSVAAGTKWRYGVGGALVEYELIEFHHEKKEH